MHGISMIFLALSVLGTVGCSPAIETVSRDEFVPQSFDGALLTYAFSRGEVTVVASFKGGVLSITPPPSTAAAQPDLNHVHSLVYSHGSLSIDQPDIMLDGVMLK
jgi:hypothetical protein